MAMTIRNAWRSIVRLNPISSRSRAFSTIDEEERRQLVNRLLYRSKQRGFLELDLVLGKWTQENIHQLDDKHLESLIQVLDLENPDLWKWLTGQAEVPESITANPVFACIQKQISGNLENHAAVETRAKPGQPWVRGWDDFKKTGPNNAFLGNQ
ncbi:succinate dehydrogenase assembly factor 2, mitochondrial [Selaginella moellendorffii]|uniref:succinate dehydrogenase assembly factor 2, mitochondrial n=1 Tax=Selaginella moellendorffii TaxID=88036 RepID=UPI000D1C85AA|nr:succinate dehydrogenase assembly factor 2, mitochondrial [Selaginella moellendorffii]|eukprot:XP_002973356.2 succinate dehydrogenase assembly factor 2, mitochondrial [Selaginella moellendorffii]